MRELSISELRAVSGGAIAPKPIGGGVGDAIRRLVIAVLEKIIIKLGGGRPQPYLT
jgi:hypothetical protein